MHFNKTQEKILAEINKSGRYSCESYAGRGGGGGLIQGGHRETNAAFALVRLGLMEMVNSHKSVIYHRGYGCTVTSYVFKKKADVDAK